MNTAARSAQRTAARPPSPSAAPWRSVSTRSQLRCRYQLAARQDLDTDHGRHYVPASEPCSHCRTMTPSPRSTTSSHPARLVPVGPFSLEAAATFGFGPTEGQPLRFDGAMRLAFPVDGGSGYAGAVLRQSAADQEITVELQSTKTADPELALKQIARIISISVTASPSPVKPFMPSHNPTHSVTSPTFRGWTRPRHDAYTRSPTPALSYRPTR